MLSIVQCACYLNVEYWPPKSGQRLSILFYLYQIVVRNTLSEIGDEVKINSHASHDLFV